MRLIELVTAGKKRGDWSKSWHGGNSTSRFAFKIQLYAAKENSANKFCVPVSQPSTVS
jgi:hypothetical protein